MVLREMVMLAAMTSVSETVVVLLEKALRTVVEMAVAAPVAAALTTAYEGTSWKEGMGQ